MSALCLINDVASPGDFILASGPLNSVGDFDANIDEDWTLIKSAGPESELVGKSKKLSRVTGWESKFTAEELPRDMVDAELARTAAENP